LSAAATSTVNLAEVHGKLVGRGLNADEAWEATLSPIREAVAFTSEHARLTGDLARTNPCTRLVIGGPGVFGTRTGFEGAGIHGRQILEEAQSQAFASTSSVKSHCVRRSGRNSRRTNACAS